MSDYIPEELLIAILKRLPVEALIRCMSVCKSWYSLITSPNFISLHLKQTTLANNNLILVRSGFVSKGGEHGSIHFDNDSFGLYKSLYLPFNSQNRCLTVIGSLNGLVCLFDGVLYAKTIFLWNPSINKFVTLLPMLRKPRWALGSYDSDAIGFGFNYGTNDCKVVRVMFIRRDEDGECKVESEVEVYELSIGSWRIVDTKGFPYYIFPGEPQTFLNGAVHWFGNNHARVVDNFSWMIVSFDIKHEVFGVIEVPHSIASQSKLRFHVALLGELLSIINSAFYENSYVDIWTMKKYGVAESWTKQFTIDLTGGLGQAFGFRKNGDILMTKSEQYSSYASLVSYDPESNQAEFLGVEDACLFYVDNFVESLVLLDRVNGEFGRRQGKFDNIAISKGFTALFFVFVFWFFFFLLFPSRSPALLKQGDGGKRSKQGN